MKTFPFLCQPVVMPFLAFQCHPAMELFILPGH